MVQMSEKPLLPEARLMDAVRAIEVSRRSMAVVVAGDAGVESHEPHPLTAEIESPDGI